MVNESTIDTTTSTTPLSLDMQQGWNRHFVDVITVVSACTRMIVCRRMLVVSHVDRVCLNMAQAEIVSLSQT